MSTKLKFNDKCGNNVELSQGKTVATWKPKNSDGWAISNGQLLPGNTVKVKVEGSGRCDVGLIKGSKNFRNFEERIEIRSNKRSAEIEIHFDRAGNRICFQFDQRKALINIKKKTKIWIASCIQYGNMCVELLSKNPLLKFCPIVKGSNVKLVKNRIRCKSICKSPASKCFISEQLEYGSRIFLECSPTSEGGRRICQRELKISVSNKYPASKSCYFITETIEKQDCNGQILISVSNRREIEFRTAKGKRNTLKLGFDIENGLWVEFELYGIEIRDVTKSVDHNIGNIYGHDQVDSVCNNLTSKKHNKNQTLLETENVQYQLLTGRVNTLEKEFKTLRSQLGRSESPVPRQITSDIGDKLNTHTHRKKLVRNIDTLSFCDSLIEKDLISDEQMQTIQVKHEQKGSIQANRLLLSCIEKNPIKKSQMREILEKTKHQHLMKMFYPHDKN